MENIERVVKIAVSVLAIVVPCLLISGLSLHLGYIHPFGLHHELVNRDLTGFIVESWYVGVYAVVWLFSKVFSWCGLLVFLLLIVTSLVAFVYGIRAKAAGKNWLFAELSRENQGKTIFAITQWQWCNYFSVSKDMSSWGYYLIIILLMILLFTVFPFQTGKNEADRQLNIYTEFGCENKDKAVSCTYLIDTKNDEEKIIAKGILVSATETKIALYDNKLEVWPLLNTYVIRKQPRHSETD